MVTICCLLFFLPEHWTGLMCVHHDFLPGTQLCVLVHQSTPLGLLFTLGNFFLYLLSNVFRQLFKHLRVNLTSQANSYLLYQWASTDSLIACFPYIVILTGFIKFVLQFPVCGKRELPNTRTNNWLVHTTKIRQKTEKNVEKVKSKFYLWWRREVIEGFLTSNLPW